MPLLPDVVALDTGHIAHHNELHDMFNEPLGDVDFVKRYDPTSITGASDETVKLQQAIDENVNNTIYLGGTYTITAPLILPTNTRLARGTLWAGSSFDFSATMPDATAVEHPVAMLMLANAGNIYAMGRCYLDRITLNGLDRPNSRGILAALQQPTVWNRFRAEHCLDYGMKIKGQQASFYDAILVRCGTGIILDNFSFARFYALNTEINDIGLTGGGFDCEIFGGHYEVNDIDFYLTSGSNWQFYGGRHSSVTGLTSFKIEAGRPTGYRIIRAHAAAATNTGVAIQDVDRGFTHQWWTDFRGNIADFDMLEVPTASAFTDLLGHVIGSAAGRRIRFGGRYAPTMVIEAGTSGLAQAQFRDSTATTRFNIGAAGNAALGVYSNATRPVAASVPVGTVIVNSDTNALNVQSGGVWRDTLGVAL